MKTVGVNYLTALKYIVLSVIILIFGRTVLVPVAYAVFIGFVLFPITHWLESKKIPRGIAIAISLMILLVIVGAIFWLFINQARSFGTQWGQLKIKVEQALDSGGLLLQDSFGISAQQIDKNVETMLNKFAGDALPVIGNTVYLSALSAFRLILVPVYAALILYRRETFVDFLVSIFYPGKREELVNILHKVVFTYYNFIKGMLIIYLVNGTLISIGLYFIGVPNPFLFGFISSILSIIPYLGIVLGAILPITLAWAVHGSIAYVFAVIGLFILVHVLEAYVVFPLAVSYRLKLSTLFTLLAIFTGGLIWGAAGMILFIPALGITKLILSTIPGKEPIVKLLEG